MDHIELTVEAITAGTIVRIGGQITRYTETELRRTLDEVSASMEGDGLLVLDLSVTDFVDAHGLGVIVSVGRRARERGGDMKLIVTSTPLIRLFENTGLTKLFEVVTDEHDLRAIGPLRLVPDLSQSRPALDELVTLLGRGADMWNAWRVAQHRGPVDLSDVRLERAELVGFDLSDCDLRRADLSGSRLETVDLRRADLRAADLSAATLVACDMREASCRGIHLIGSNLRSVHLDGADFTDAELYRAAIISSSACSSRWDRAFLSRTSLHDTDFTNAHLAETTIDGSDLTGADLRHARLWRTVLRSTLLARCRLDRSRWNEVIVVDCDYSGADGLTGIVHEDRSSIAVDAVARSLRDPHLDFLAAAGIPRSVGVYLVDALRAESSDLLRYGSVFLAHSSMDTLAVDAVYDHLRQAGVPTFVARYDLLPGDDLDASIDREIGAADHVVLFCSRASLDRTSTGWWVDRELRLILDRERRQAGAGRGRRRLLIPVLLDHHLLSDECDHPLRSDIAGRVAADLSADDRREAELARLLRAIRAVPFVDGPGGDEGVTPPGRGAAG